MIGKPPTASRKDAKRPGKSTDANRKTNRSEVDPKRDRKKTGDDCPKGKRLI